MSDTNIGPNGCSIGNCSKCAARTCEGFGALYLCTQCQVQRAEQRGYARAVEEIVDMFIDLEYDSAVNSIRAKFGKAPQE